eukprot:16444669-Heterocapsa_arctica.AAC.1
MGGRAGAGVSLESRCQSIRRRPTSGCSPGPRWSPGGALGEVPPRGGVGRARQFRKLGRGCRQCQSMPVRSFGSG